VAAGLPGVPVRLVKGAVAAGKRRCRARERRRRARARIHLAAACPDVVWSLDATHLGRGPRGGAIEGQVVRDVATMRTVALSAGSSPTARDVTALLERACERRGTLPLVLVTDNGGPYVSGDLARYLERHRVVHLFNLPHTPQHNAWAERAIGELKAESGLGKGVVLRDHAEALARLRVARARLDHHRLRAALDYRTAAEAAVAWPVRYNATHRERFFGDACRRVEDAVNAHVTKYARRRAVREAILAVLEDHGHITRTRGGRPLRAVKAEAVS
jgi:transposase InsO family protein